MCRSSVRRSPASARPIRVRHASRQRFSGTHSLRSPLLCDRDYVGKASAPEWGIQLTGKSQPYLEEFSFGVQARLL